MRTGIFTGSFDPYTIGHDNILRRALPLFDRIIIGIGVNEQKKYMLSADMRKKKIQELYRNEPRITVKTYNDLTIDFAKREMAQYIIKGVRSVKDFEYEREMAEANYRLSGIDTLLLFADPSLSFLSSSMVRELIHFGKDVREFLPTAKK
jgi:pantetheine-phosphate adenylyltransferase